MNRPIIFDACSLINILIIDDDDHMLLKAIKQASRIGNQDHLYIAEIVGEEINSNLSKRVPEKEERSEKFQTIREFTTTYYTNEINTGLGKTYIDKIRAFLNYGKKENGELYSSALALILSRENNTRVTFYTDDFPAKEQFAPFFEHQQMGYISDSVDLLLFLHWSDKHFTVEKLKGKLKDLKACYYKLSKEILDILDKRDKHCKKTKLRKDIEIIRTAIVNGKDLDSKQFEISLEKFGKEWLHDHDKITDKLSLNNPWIVRKIEDVLRNIEKFEVFKI